MYKHIPGHLNTIITVFIAGILSGLTVAAQDGADMLTITNGSELVIRKNSLVHVQGNAYIDTNANIDNCGIFSLSDTLKSHSGNLFTSSSNPFIEEGGNDSITYGVVRFTGPGPQEVTGLPEMYFNDIRLNNNRVTLWQNIKSFGEISLGNGNLFLNGRHINLFDLSSDVNRKSGTLKAGTEQPGSVVYDDSSGTVKACKLVDNKKRNLANLGLEIFFYTKKDNYPFITRSHVPDTTATNGSIKKVFDIDSIDGTIGSLTFHYLQPDVLPGMDESGFSVFYKNIHGDPPLFYQKLDYKKFHQTFNYIYIDTLELRPGRYTIAGAECHEKPAVDIGPPDTTICEGQDITLSTYNTPGQPMLYDWSISPYIPAADTTGYTITFRADDIPLNDTLVITLTATNTRACDSTDTIIVYTHANPVMHVKTAGNVTRANKLYLCARDTLILYDSLAQPGQYLWAFGDNDTAYTDSVAHAYKAPGNYSVHATYTSLHHCKTDTSIHVTTNPLPAVSLETDTAHCLDHEVVFANNTSISSQPVSASIKSYTWFPGITANDSILVTQHGVQSTGRNLDFETTTIQYNNVSPDLAVQYPRTGHFAVTLRAESDAGCTRDTTSHITVHDTVAGAIDTALLSGTCYGMPVFFTTGGNTSANAVQCTWILDKDTAISGIMPHDTIHYTFNAPGRKNISLIVYSPFGCADTVLAQMQVSAVAEPEFQAMPVCRGDSTMFVNHTDEANVTRYTWDFGDGHTRAAFPGQVIRHGYDTAGAYRVRLTAFNHEGCMSMATDTAYVAPLPQPWFIPHNTCFNNQDTATLLENMTPDATRYLWNFGDATSSAEKEPGKQYSSEGTYQVILTAYKTTPLPDTSLECQAGFTDQVTIYEPVISAFDVESSLVCQGSEVQFSLSPNATRGNISHYKWDFGNGDTLVTTNSIIHYTYPGYGTYRATLQSVSNAGCTGEASGDIIVSKAPDIDLTASVVCHGELTSFNATNTDAGMYVHDFHWDFGDTSVITGADTSTRANPFYTYQSPGVYQAVLTSVNGQGCSARDTAEAVVYPVPEPDMGDKAGGCGGTATLGAGPDGHDYRWSTGETSKTITVSTGGMYTVTITNPATGCFVENMVDVLIEDDISPVLGDTLHSCGAATLDAEYQGAGYLWNTGQSTRAINATESGIYAVTVSIDTCTGSDSVQVFVHDIPDVHLGPDTSICYGDSILLSAGIATPATYLWSDGSHEPSVTVRAAANSTRTTNYWVSVTNEHACSAADNIVIALNRIPEIHLGDDMAICSGRSVSLDATDTDPGTTYLWDNGYTGAVRTVNAGQEDVSEYSVQATAPGQCAVHDEITIRWHALPDIPLGSDTVSCAGNLVTLDATVPGAIAYRWNTGDSTARLLATETNDYQVKVTNAHGCTAISDYISVEYLPEPVALLPDQASACNSMALDAGNYGADYMWNTQTGARQITVYESGTYTVTITNGHHCSITDSTRAVIHYITKPYLGSDRAICESQSTVLKPGIHDSTYHYTWSTGSHLDTLVVAAEGEYRVHVERDNGCTASDTIHITVNEQPYIDLGPDMILCNRENTTLDAGYSNAYYQWGSNTGITGSGRWLDVDTTGTYWVQVTTADFCTDSDTITLEPTANNITPMFIAASKLRMGDSVQFMDMSSSRPMSWLWDFGDLQRSTERDPVHVFYGCDTFKVTLNVSNGICNASIIKPMVVNCNKSFSYGDMNPNWKAGDQFIEITESKVYPNPNSRYIWVEADLSAKANTEIYIFNIMGKLIEIDRFSGMQYIRQYYNTEHYTPGIYILKIIAGTDQKTYKIIKE